MTSGGNYFTEEMKFDERKRMKDYSFPVYHYSGNGWGGGVKLPRPFGFSMQLTV